MAAELCRRGLLATTFTGNVPDIAIVAVNDKLEARPIQVKAIKSGSWQFNARKFLDIEYDKKRKTQQIRKKRLPYPGLKYVLVDLKDENTPVFYIMDMKRLRDIIYRRYSKQLEKHGGRRPKAPESTHTMVKREMVRYYLDNWDSIFK